MSFEIRTLLREQIPACRQALAAGFGYDSDPDDEAATERFDAIFGTERAFPAFDGNEIVGTGSDLELNVTVPGGAQVPMSGLTIITVRPTHTRQGVLTAMMREHVDRARKRGEPLGGLWASEVPIYGRFGYGPATLMHGIKFDARLAGRGGSEPGVTVRLAGGDEAETVLPQLYNRAMKTRPGMYKRSEDWWKYRLFHDPEKHRDGASALRHAVAERNGEPIGYVTYRQKASWDLLSEGELRIRELIPVDDAAYRALWHYAANIDLFPIVKYWSNPVDDPLPLIMRDGRTVVTTDYSDGLWVRLIDVADALVKRSYSGTGSVVISIADQFCPWNEGTYRLVVDDGTAACEKVAAEPDVAMDVNTLGAMYLGGRDAVSFARAGRIEGDAAAVARFGTLFRSSPAPWCPEIF
ncbi:MAG: GNAT family N-acetyltransferase [bacterium]|nr:GNAT family N-acetyltransferase [bacterium]